MVKLRIVFLDDEDGWVTVYCPELPGCVSQGKGIAEARANIQEAIEGFMEMMVEDIIVDNRKKAGELDGENSGDAIEDSVEIHFSLVSAE